MKRFKNILVATDTRFENHPILEEAAEIAQHNGASLKVVDIVPEFPWTVRLTLAGHEHVRQLIAQEKQEKLESLAARIREKGIQVETSVLKGRASTEIIAEVVRAEHDLVLRVAKGEGSRRAGFFGNTSVRLLRTCPCAVWLVAPETSPQFKHVLGCIDTSTGDALDAELNANVYELASSISQYNRGRFSIVHVWSIFGEQMFSSRMKPEEFEALEKDNHDQVERLLANFLADHDGDVRADNIHMLKGDPVAVIPDFASSNDVDLVVMGTVARSGVSGMLMGNTAEQILNRIECSVLALKPSSLLSSKNA